jgi:hypothetical protein
MLQRFPRFEQVPIQTKEILALFTLRAQFVCPCLGLLACNAPPTADERDDQINHPIAVCVAVKNRIEQRNDLGVSTLKPNAS